MGGSRRPPPPRARGRPGPASVARLDHEADHEHGRDPGPHQRTTGVTNLTTIAVPKNVAVATRLAGENIDPPPRPLPDGQPAAVWAPKPMRIPAANSTRP